MARAVFDHLVIGADTLDQAADWSAATLGVELGPGGAHPSMGTHNLLGRLAAGYVEAIARDPAAPAPSGHKRWYDLDNPALQKALAERPRPIAWVIAVDDIDAAVAAAPWSPGPVRTASRGALTWRIATPDDGAPPLGVLPALIEWPAELGRRAPRDRMRDLGLALRRLRLRAEDPREVRAALDAFALVGALRRDGVELVVDALEDADASRIEAMITPSTLNTRV